MPASSEPTVPPQSKAAGGLARGHGEDVLGRQQLGVVAGDAVERRVQQPRRPHDLEAVVEGVVAAESDAQAPLAPAGHGRDAVEDVLALDRRVGQGAAGRGQHPRFAVGEEHAVDGEEAGPEHAQLGQVLERSAAEHGEGELDLLAVAAHVHLERRPAVGRQLGRQLEVAGRARRDVGRQHGAFHQAGAGGIEAVEEGGGAREVGVGRRGTHGGRRSATPLPVDRLVVRLLIARTPGHDRPHPDLGHGVEQHRLVVGRRRRLGQAGDARAQELGHHQPGGQGHVGRRHGVLGGEVEAVDHRQLMGDERAHEGLRQVGVAVDHAGHHDAAAAAQPPAGGVGRLDVGAGTDGDDAAVATATAPSVITRRAGSDVITVPVASQSRSSTRALHRRSVSARGRRGEERVSKVIRISARTTVRACNAKAYAASCRWCSAGSTWRCGSRCR